MKPAELYEADFAEWARRNAELLRAGRVAEADLENIAEEIDDMAKPERRELRRRLARLIDHLLQWQYQPHKRSPSWRRTLAEQRNSIGVLLKDSPSLRRELAQFIEEAYPHAVRLAMAAMPPAEDRFPEQCPYTEDQLLDEEFLPGSA